MNMVRMVVGVCAAVSITISALSAQTLEQRLAELPKANASASGKRPQVIIEDTRSSALLFPVAANVAGLNGTYFRSDLTITNFASGDEEIEVYWLAAGQNNCGAVPAATLNMPSHSTASIHDFVGTRLNRTGIGALTIFGGTAGSPDASARLDGMSRLWTPAFGGTTSMSFPPVSPMDSTGSLGAYALGLRQDDGFRTNVGIVNEDHVSHVWTVQVLGTSGTTSFTVSIGPCSMNQVALPVGDYGDLSLVFNSDGVGFYWSAYGASVDNVTGDSWSVHASQ